MRYLAISLLLLLTACGVVSPLHDATTLKRPDLSGYNSVIIVDFEHAFAVRDEDADFRKLEKLGAIFAELIEDEIKKLGLFATVRASNRVETPYKTLVIRGVITEYTAGNSFVRMMAGWTGAGNMFFDSLVEFYDHPTGAPLGQIQIHKHGWALGGSIAAAQTVDDLMQAAAKQVAKEVQKSIMRQIDEENRMLRESAPQRRAVSR